VPIRSTPRDEITPSRAPAPVFTIVEVGLSNRQVWAATLGELARRGAVSRAELETWLRPAGLIGRDGATLLVGAPNAVARDRIASRLLPVLREALAATIGVTVGIEVVVQMGVEESRSRGVEQSERPGA
jgi:chromosomal replication initiation ATPase DnaA